MQFLRSKFFNSLCVLLVFGGYAISLFADCDRGCGEHREMKQAACSTAKPCGHAPERTGDSCQCLCHQAVAYEFTFAPLVAADAAELTKFLMVADIAPDGVPVAIDHPPQLA